MGYPIETVQIWSNGQSETGNWIDANIVLDNLNDYAQFFWKISNITSNEEGETKQILTQGNTTISGEAYDVWGSTSDVNLAAYEYICTQLNLTLIP